ncbi:MAG: caa(3)-type oxidase subunit IV [Planctomycetota bacterium]|nr:MAG: caa(3)-type oxidase subunit IV [Planctomycetota bacterium]
MMSHETESNYSPPPPGSQPSVGHEVPWTTLAATAVALLILTWITVAVAQVHLGEFNLWVALIIATIKASLVCLYFMHLRYDRPFNRIAWVAGFAFVALFIGLTLTDVVSYQDTVYRPTDTEYAPARERAISSNVQPE